jgi:polysaccharide deacetylase family protein (PEP-CTERM system associated)
MIPRPHDPSIHIHNALSIDVEDYYMVSAFADRIKFDDWPSFESRVERNTRALLDELDRQGVKATFFVLGWIGEKQPKLVSDIHEAGHEVASHGYNHRLVYDLSPAQFREDVRISKKILENITGTAVRGFRATSYSIVKETFWALDVLLEEGYHYDSSIFPVHHDRYGVPDAERFQHAITTGSGTIVEFPPSTYRVLRQNIPVAGGGYLRLYPLSITKRAIRSINAKEQKAAMVYLHPWEIDTDQPRLRGGWKSRARHYINLHTTMPKLKSLLSEFSFGPVSSQLAAGPRYPGRKDAR